MNGVVERAIGAARRARRWIASFRPAVAVLLYHRIADDPHDPFGLCVHPDRFDDQLARLARRYAVLAMDELALALDRGLPKRAVVLTFDDGYADLGSRASAMLASHRVRATAFIAAAALGHPEIFWWDQLTQLLLEAPSLPRSLRLRVGGTSVEWQQAMSRLDIYYDAHHRLRSLAADDRMRALGDLRSQIPGFAESPSDRRPLTNPELRELFDCGWIGVGCHTSTHPSLPAETPDVQRAEILAGRRRLEALLDTSINSFAYPHGDVSEATVDIVRRCDFRLAFTAEAGLVAAGADHFRLPRLTVPDCSGEALCDRLDAWFSGSRNPWPS